MSISEKRMTIGQNFLTENVGDKKAAAIIKEAKKRREDLKSGSTSKYIDVNQAEDIYNTLFDYELITKETKSGYTFVHAWDKHYWREIYWVYEDAQNQTVRVEVYCTPTTQKRTSKAQVFSNSISTLAEIVSKAGADWADLKKKVSCLCLKSEAPKNEKGALTRHSAGEQCSKIGDTSFVVFRATSTGQKIKDIADCCKNCTDGNHQNLRLEFLATTDSLGVRAPLKGEDDSLKGADEEEATGTLFNDLQKLIDNGAHQLVLTGAPGTGKTFQAKKVASAYRLNNQLYNYYSENKTSLDEFIACLLYDQSFYDDVKAGYIGGGFGQLKQEAIDAICEEISKGTEDDNTYTQEDFWQDVASLRGLCALVQFHPSYDYTDFVEGLRPVEGDSGEMVFKRMDGSFMAFCRYVAWLNTKTEERPPYFFIIDEINRADLSKVLGELMFSLEGDKRGENNPINTQYKNLTTHFLQAKDHGGKEFETYTSLFENGFFIPENVVVIGTMNNIDRSVESMDFALRRRFTWKDVVVDETLLTDSFKSSKFFKDVESILREKVAEYIRKRILAFNKELHGETMHKIAPHLNSDYDISQGHFMAIAPNAVKEGSGTAEAVANNILQWVWDYRIESLLKEYLRGCQGSQNFDPMTYLESLWNAPVAPAPAADKQEESQSGEEPATDANRSDKQEEA